MTFEAPGGASSTLTPLTSRAPCYSWRHAHHALPPGPRRFARFGNDAEERRSASASRGRPPSRDDLPRRRRHRRGWVRAIYGRAWDGRRATRGGNLGARRCPPVGCGSSARARGSFGAGQTPRVERIEGSTDDGGRSYRREHVRRPHERMNGRERDDCQRARPESRQSEALARSPAQSEERFEHRHEDERAQRARGGLRQRRTSGALGGAIYPQRPRAVHEARSPCDEDGSSASGAHVTALSRGGSQPRRC